MAPKIKLFCCLVLFGLNSFAQKLSPQEKTVFDDVAFSRAKIGEYEKTQKWVIPIRYKVYGDTLAYLVKDVDSIFNQLKKLTALNIQKSTDEDEINFKIVFGTDPEFFKAYTLNKKPLISPGNYRRRVNVKNEIYQAELLLNTKLYDTRVNIKNGFRRMLLKCIGFTKTTDLVPNSLFYSGHNGKVKIDVFDSNIISALYAPLVKPGATKDEVDALIK